MVASVVASSMVRVGGGEVLVLLNLDNNMTGGGMAMILIELEKLIFIELEKLMLNFIELE